MACAKVVSDFELLTVEDAGRRRAWTEEEKVRIVEESLRGHRQGCKRGFSPIGFAATRVM